MSKVTVVGAGNVGATCANVIATREIADEVVLLPIYPAREEPIPGITSEIIARRVAAPCRIVDRDHLADEVAAMDTDVVISFGAGNIDACCPALAERLKMKS